MHHVAGWASYNGAYQASYVQPLHEGRPTNISSAFANPFSLRETPALHFALGQRRKNSRYSRDESGPLHTSTLLKTLRSTCSRRFRSARLAVVDAVDALLWAPSVLMARPRRAHSAMTNRGFVRA